MPRQRILRVCSSTSNYWSNLVLVNIRIQTLGDIRVSADDTKLPEVPAQRLRCAFLIILAVQREITREAIATLLWPERADDKAVAP